ncbi:hypothetical protein E3E27_06270 [Thermococcus sp. MV11]|nr:hypothetical protein [Thermococcus sp. MV11]
MKKFRGLIAIFLATLIFVGVSGCLGGGGEESPTASESYTEGEHATTPGAGETGGTTSGGYTTESPTQSGTTTTEMETPTETETGYASWQNPWDAHNPVQIDGESYLITYIKYKLRVRTEEGGPVYEYEVEKRRGPVKIHVYGNSIDMETGKQEKVDLGEFEVYEYYGKIIPINAEDMSDAFEYRLWVVNRSEDTDTFFLFPTLDFLTLYSSLYAGTGDVVGVMMKYGNQTFEFYNPIAVGKGSIAPYQEGDINMLSDIADIEAIYLSWYGFYNFGFWTALEDENIYQETTGSWGVMGYQYNYEVKPDGTVNLGGKEFRVSSVSWTYTFGSITGQGEATIAANLPVPVEAKGVFIEQGGANVFTHVKIEDIGFEKA